MSKRGLEPDNDDFFSREFRTKTAKKYENNVKKHTLDSDEEDEVDETNVLDDDDIEGEEDGVSGQEGGIRMTAFNMQEEMELGHFDKEGHFIWKNEKEVRDNWLDNIDWHKIKENSKFSDKDGKVKGLGDESDSEDDEEDKFDEIEVYGKIIEYMKPKENINKALRRLGGDVTKLSSVEKLKRRKAGTLQNNKEVTDLTELANKILNTGNMDIYQETFEQITQKLNNHKRKMTSQARIVEAESDMFSDAFELDEKARFGEAGGSSEAGRLGETGMLGETEKMSEDGSTVETTGLGEPGGSGLKKLTSSGSVVGLREEEVEVKSKDLLWEFKWNQKEDKIEGPFNTIQMLKWSEEGYFKTGVWVRKRGGEDSNFYSSNRIDFDLYL